MTEKQHAQLAMRQIERDLRDLIRERRRQTALLCIDLACAAVAAIVVAAVLIGGWL